MAKFVKASGETYFEMQKAILHDQGSGSIFKNITSINEYISERLRQKIDLTRPNQLPQVADTSKMDKMALHLLEKTEEQIREEESKKQQSETREELMTAISTKFKEAEQEMTDRMTRIIKEANQ